MIVLGFGLAAAGCLALLVWGYSMIVSGERVAESAVVATPKTAKKNDVFILNAIADVVGRPFTGLAMELLAPWRAGIRKRIDAAGRPGGMTVESYARTTAGYVVIFATVALLMAAMSQYTLGLLCLLGALQNEGLLRGRMNARQNDIQRSLPDFLDVLAVTVSAGLSFRVALTRVSDSMPGALADEFLIALRQMELGTPRREAFEDLRNRNSSEALASFVTALLQAEELGAPLQTALMDISADMRRESAQWAKRKAQRTTPQITAVTTALTLPAVMLLVLGGMFFGSGADLGGFFGN
ncbi:type II secretion system F family protein [Actinomadura rayongensis]|uniref:Type II secretion system (T2SS), F family protein n=1 Tax=Actinomadura rayongensis TaxID=1429076 RepID=A0A6I4VYB7_9ACTN|nr:type II secretion system F family protein [Actinomadura rayongensis]MXQ62947.1 type II secretion system (T2SS), F family protein [Actinomadura rayongensis]